MSVLSKNFFDAKPQKQCFNVHLVMHGQFF
jgi:hypothetical protein